MPIRFIYYVVAGVTSLTVMVYSYTSQLSMEETQIEEAPSVEMEVLKIDLPVPFTSQAPFGNWNMPYQEACEEASLIMVAHFLNGGELDPETADNEILELVQWETENGYSVDISAEETLEIAQNYFGLSGEVFYGDEVTIEKIKETLSAGNPVIIPAAGRVLENPNYLQPNPAYHMIVLKGFDESHFISNDPGTKAGKDYKYTYEILYQAIHDWAGSKENILEGEKAMIVLYFDTFIEIR